MKWYYVFMKSVREQIRDYWILILTMCFAPFFVFMYYLMSETGTPEYNIMFSNLDRGASYGQNDVNLGDSLVHYLRQYALEETSVRLNYLTTASREQGMQSLREGKADVLIVLPPDLSSIFLAEGSGPAQIELVGDVTNMDYIVGAVWTEEVINGFVIEASGIRLPLSWKETSLGYSGERSEFDLYVPGLMIFAIIMMMFTASASIVREPEAGTIERLKISRLGALEFLAGLSLVQLMIGILSLLLTVLIALALGYELIPGTLGFILLIGFLTSLSMISFSLIVAAMCRSIKDVAIIGTFPLMLLMFFSGAFFPIGGGRLFSLGGYSFYLNDLLSPTWAVDALNKVLIKGLDTGSTFPEIIALLILTLLYFVIGVYSFRKRHMRAA